MRSNRDRALAFLVTALAALAAVGWMAVRSSRHGPRDSEVGRLVRALGERRPYVGRLTGGFRFAPTASPTEPLQADPEFMAAVLRLRLRAEASPSRYSRHAIALAHLLLGETGTAIRLLEALASDSEVDAAVLSDLSAAYLAEAPSRPYLYPRAIESAAHALEMPNEVAEARYNLALGLSAMGLSRSAMRAWAMTERMTSGPWAREASARRTELALPPPSRDVVRYQDLEAALADRDGTDEAWVSRLRPLLRSLAAAVDDPAVLTLGDPEPMTLSAWRSLLALYGDARKDYASGDWERARRGFRVFLDRAPDGGALRDWAQAYDAILESRIGDKGHSAARLRALVARPLPPGLAGRCLWTLGLMALEAGNYGQALHDYESAQESFRISREADYQRSIEGQISNVLDRLGRYSLAWGPMVSLLRASDVGDLRRVVTLGRTANMAYGQGLLRVAEKVALEAAELAQATKSNELAAIRVTQSRIAARLGRPETALAALSSARTEAAGVSDRGLRGRLETEIALLDVELWSLGVIAPGSGAALPSVPLGESGDLGRLFPLTVARGLGLERAGRKAEAIAAFESAIGYIEETRAPDQTRISLILPAVATPFEHLIATRFDEGDHWAALAYIERLNDLRRPYSHRALSGGALRAAVREWADERPVTVLFPLSERLLVWDVTRDSIRATALPLRRDELEVWVERVRGDVEVGKAVPESRLSRIVRTAVRRSGRSDVLLSPNGRLTRLPWRAILSSVAGQNAEPLTIEVLPTLIPAPLPGAGSRHTVSVFGPGALEGRSLLPSAEPESREVAGIYGGADLFLNRAATLAALDRALPSSRVIHFAGHASQNAAHPELSSLWLSDEGSAAAMPVTLRDLKTDSLAGLPLLYLSACSTGLASEETGFAGSSLADLFLDAGVSAIVAPVTEVDDRVSAAVAAGFHRAYAAGASPPEALRISIDGIEQAGAPHAFAYEVFLRKTSRHGRQ